MTNDDDDLDPRLCNGQNSNICVAEGCFGESCLTLGWQPLPHVHIDVVHFDDRGGGSYCMYEYGAWRVDKNTQSLVIGRKLNRLHIPLVGIMAWKVVPGPKWCNGFTPNKEG